MSKPGFNDALPRPELILAVRAYAKTLLHKGWGWQFVLAMSDDDLNRLLPHTVQTLRGAVNALYKSVLNEKVLPMLEIVPD